MDTQLWSIILGGLFGASGIGAAIVKGVGSRKKVQAEADKIRRESEATVAKIRAEAESIAVATLSAVIDELREQNAAATQQVAGLHNEMGRVQAANANLNKRIDDCERDRAELHAAQRIANQRLAALEAEVSSLKPKP